MAHYKLRQPGLASLADAMIAPPLLDAIERRSLAQLVREPAAGVFEFALFTEEACAALLRELHAFEHHCARTGHRPERPNSMNAYGVVLRELGLEYAMDDLLSRCIAPLSDLLLPAHHPRTLDHQHAFVVEYFEGGDRELGFHVDDSEVTLNLCLGSEFTGSQVYFEGERCDVHRGDASSEAERFEWAPRPGHALLHAGANRHGVRPLHDGRRTNLIVWARSTSHRRRSPAPHEGPAPWCPRCK